jgi:hypothetical protein
MHPAIAQDMPLSTGHNNYGQLGDGYYADRNFPVGVRNLNGVTAVTGGADFSLALKSDGTVWAGATMLVVNWAMVLTPPAMCRCRSVA